MEDDNSHMVLVSRVAISFLLGWLEGQQRPGRVQAAEHMLRGNISGMYEAREPQWIREMYDTDKAGKP